MKSQLDWIKARVGCHWHADHKGTTYTISSFSCADARGYIIVVNRQRLQGVWPTLTAAQQYVRDEVTSW